MNSVKEILLAEFELLRAEVIAKYAKAGTDMASAITLQELPNGMSLMADGYINGRKPGKAPPSQAIELWLEQKGIASRLAGTINISSLAFLIARRIAREGWKPKQGAGTVIDSIVTPQRIQQILDKVSYVYMSGFTTEILNYLKTFAA